MAKRYIIQSHRWVLVDRDNDQRVEFEGDVPYDILLNGVVMPAVTGCQEGDGDGFVRCDALDVPDDAPFVTMTGRDVTEFTDDDDAPITIRIPLDNWKKYQPLNRALFGTHHTVVVSALLWGRVEFRRREPAS